MGWRRQGTQAMALVLVVLAGCSLPDFFGVKDAPTGGGAGKDQTLNASLAAVSKASQLVLQEMGISAQATEEGERVTIQCASPKGTAFVLRLTRIQDAKGGEQTHVTIGWQGNPDEAVAIRLVEGIKVMSSAAH